MAMFPAHWCNIPMNTRFAGQIVSITGQCGNVSGQLELVLPPSGCSTCPAM